MNRIKKDEDLMADIERTAAGFQTVLPGCERRTLPKSTTRSDDVGQGLLEFYRPPTLRETLPFALTHHCNRSGRGPKRSRKSTL